MAQRVRRAPCCGLSLCLLLSHAESRLPDRLVWFARGDHVWDAFILGDDDVEKPVAELERLLNA